MGTDAAELVESGEKRDGRGRKIVPVDRQRELIAAYEQSGLTQKVFAQQEGLRYPTFVAWLGRHRRGVAASGAPRTFQEFCLGAGGSAASLEVRLPNGTTVRGRSAPEIAELVRALSA